MKDNFLTRGWSALLISHSELATAESFIVHCSSDFLDLETYHAPDIVARGYANKFSVYWVNQPARLKRFFKAIWMKNPRQFLNICGEFDAALPSLNVEGIGWEVTRFGGYVHLTLRVAEEIYIRRVPKNLGRAVVALAKYENRFLDSGIYLHAERPRKHQMSPRLAGLLTLQ